MTDHLDKVRTHAAREFNAPGSSEPALVRARRFLKVEEFRLRLQHRAGEGGWGVAQRRAAMTDVLLIHLFEEALQLEPGSEPVPLALIALGGYGRAEICPQSDIDILFLHGRTGDDPPPAAAETVQRILYQLWDLGFRVGHSTRSLAGVTEHANADLIFKTSLLEARFLSGDRALFDLFDQTFERLCVHGRGQEYFDWRVADTATRMKKYGPTVFLQEPQVKWSPGGLRDYHNVLWTAHFTPFRQAVRRDGMRALVGAELLELSEWKLINSARDFLLRARTELHYLDGRAADTLTLNHQPQIATLLRYPQTNDLRRNEALMKDYYGHARNLHLITTELFGELRRSALVDPAGPDPRPPLPLAEEVFDGFFSRNGLIYPASRDVFERDSVRLLRVFHHAQTREEDLSPELFQLIRRKLSFVNRTYQYSRAAREVFFAILDHRGQVARILRRMHEAGVLGRYLPEFGALFCLVQHEFFHRYTTDEHTLVCLEKLDRLLTSTDSRLAEYRKLFEELADPGTLYLAILLHDTGKATAARHHSEASALFAQKVAARLQLSPDRRRALIFLVDHHLTLSNTAQRRNVDDPATIIEFAQIVKTRPALDSLMLLTLADGQGTGDEHWSDWKESLVWQMHRSATQYLKDGEYFARLANQRREQTANEIRGTLGPAYRDEIDAHFFHMPERYFQAFSAGAVAEHLLLMGSYLAQFESDQPAPALAPAIAWRARPESGHSEVWIWTWDRNDLLPKIAGSFAAAGLNILGADLYPRGDHLAFHLFRVCGPGFRVVEDERDQKPFGVTLAAALQDLEPFDFRPLWLRSRRRRAPLLPGLDFPTRVVLTSQSTSEYTLVEVQTPDRLGLLYDLLDAFAGLGARVASSRIATQNGAALDSFYLQDPRTAGRITDRELLRRIESAIRQITSAAAPA